ncbi:MAG: hypothetical protein JXR23_08790 [Pontiellaceae bacterium]|nr:hypothetical protein [Pontiellaceae bacterium]
MKTYGQIGVITGAALGGLALLMLMMSGVGDNPPAMQTYLIAAAIIFGAGLIAGAIEGGKPK